MSCPLIKGLGQSFGLRWQVLWLSTRCSKQRRWQITDVEWIEYCQASVYGMCTHEKAEKQSLGTVHFISFLLKRPKEEAGKRRRFFRSVQGKSFLLLHPLAAAHWTVIRKGWHYGAMAFRNTLAYSHAAVFLLNQPSSSCASCLRKQSTWAVCCLTHVSQTFHAGPACVLCIQLALTLVIQLIGD
jgi:hypothetical protein